MDDRIALFAFCCKGMMNVKFRDRVVIVWYCLRYCWLLLDGLGCKILGLIQLGVMNLNHTFVELRLCLYELLILDLCRDFLLFRINCILIYLKKNHGGD